MKSQIFWVVVDKNDKIVLLGGHKLAVFSNKKLAKYYILLPGEKVKRFKMVEAK